MTISSAPTIAGAVIERKRPKRNMLFYFSVRVRNTVPTATELEKSSTAAASSVETRIRSRPQRVYDAKGVSADETDTGEKKAEPWKRFAILGMHIGGLRERARATRDAALMKTATGMARRQLEDMFGVPAERIKIGRDGLTL